MKRLIGFFVVLALEGCVTPGQFQDRLTALHGQPLSVAIDKLGLPTTEQTVAGLHLIRWSVVSGNEYQCTLTLQVDEHDIIRKHSADGNLGGCERYIRALK